MSNELEQIVNEQRVSSEVEDAHLVTFLGKEHVHLDLKNGDIVITGIDPNEALHIECK